MREIVKTLKRQTTGWEKIVGNHVSANGQLSKLNNKIKAQIEKWSKKPEQTLLQRRYRDGKSVHEKMLNLFGHWGSYFKTVKFTLKCTC